MEGSGIRKVHELAKQIQNPINLSLGQPDFDVPESIKAKVIEAIAQGKNGYVSTCGDQAVRDTLAEKASKTHQKWKDYNPNGSEGFDVMLTSGVTGGIFNALGALINPGDEVIIPDPYFLLYKEVVSIFGGKNIFLDTYPDFSIQKQDLLSVITPKTKAIILNSPGNPTGALIHESEMKEIVSICEKNNIIIISDEIYCDFIYSGDRTYISPADYSENVLVLRGFSKSHSMTGWRIGYAYGPSKLIRAMEKMQAQSYVCPSSIAQFAIAEALVTEISDKADHYRERMSLAIDILKDDFEITLPHGGFYIFPKVPEHLEIDALGFAKKAISKEVLVVPGDVFSRKNTNFRLSITCPEEKLVVGLNRLKEIAKER